MSSRPQMHAGRRSERRTCRQDGLARRAGDWGEGGDQRQRWRRGGSDGVGVTMRIRQAEGGGRGDEDSDCGGGEDDEGDDDRRWSWYVPGRFSGLGQLESFAAVLRLMIYSTD